MPIIEDMHESETCGIAGCARQAMPVNNDFSTQPWVWVFKAAGHGSEGCSARPWSLQAQACPR